MRPKRNIGKDQSIREIQASVLAIAQPQAHSPKPRSPDPSPRFWQIEILVEVLVVARKCKGSNNKVGRTEIGIWEA